MTTESHDDREGRPLLELGQMRTDALLSLAGEMLQYMEMAQVQLEAEHGCGRSLAELVADKDMPDLYWRLRAELGRAGGRKETMYLVMNIGCLECGVSSKIVGLFAEKARADAVATACIAKHSWREDGQNAYEVFALPEPERVDAEYEGVA